jgi:hypothetical protein
MTAPEKAPAAAVDWPEIRRAYEDSDITLQAIAARHCIDVRTIQRRRLKENWLMRNDKRRAARSAALASSKAGGVDWFQVRLDYEAGELSIPEICQHHGCSKTSLQNRKRLESWVPRRPSFPKAFAAGGAINPSVRLKAMFMKKLEAVEQYLQLDEKIDPADPLKGMLTLISALQKFVDIEAKERRRDDGERNCRLIIDDASREALARRIGELARDWKHERDSRAAEAVGIPPA